MKYTKQYIDALSKNTSFLFGNIEKVERLLDALEWIFSDKEIIS